MEDAIHHAFQRVKQLTEIEGPHGWIQWKGTDVCMDVICACGAHGHIDADFAYRLRCPACGRVYHVGQYVKLVEALPGEPVDCCVDIGDVE